VGFIEGLDAYLEKHYGQSIFSQNIASDTAFVIKIHGHETRNGRIVADKTYDVVIDDGSGTLETIPKVHIKYLYNAAAAAAVAPLLKMDASVKAQGLAPIYAPRDRHFIKNKSLFPLMQEKRVLFFTLLEGEVLRGIIGGFNRYEITLLLKGGHPIVILRHAVYDLRDKKMHCFLKSFQETSRDWEQSPLYKNVVEEKGEAR